MDIRLFMSEISERVSSGMRPLFEEPYKTENIGKYKIEESIDGLKIIAGAKQYKEYLSYSGAKDIKIERYVLNGAIVVLDSDNILKIKGGIFDFQPEPYKGENPLYNFLFGYRGKIAKTEKGKIYCAKEIIKGLEMQSNATSLLHQFFRDCGKGP